MDASPAPSNMVREKRSAAKNGVVFGSATAAHRHHQRGIGPRGWKTPLKVLNSGKIDPSGVH